MSTVKACSGHAGAIRYRAAGDNAGGLDMYGLVNIALRDMLVAEHGEAAWQQVCTAAKVDNDAFISNESYPDELTYALVAAAVAEIGEDPASLLQAFGRYWVLETAQRSYAELLEASGPTFLDFMRNLPDFHTRVTLIYRELRPPTFACVDVTDRSLLLHYMSDRDGLAPFVVGLLEGLGQRFHTAVGVEHVEARTPQSKRDVFRVTWSAR